MSYCPAKVRRRLLGNVLFRHPFVVLWKYQRCTQYKFSLIQMFFLDVNIYDVIIGNFLAVTVVW
jgi:hypothetical protein